MLENIKNNHLCNVTLLGNLVVKPKIRYQANPILAIAEFTLATHSRWLDKASKRYKEWTSYHVVKVIGDIVERSLVHAQKGELLLIQGYLLNSKKTGREIIHATYAQAFTKGYARSINQIHCSGEIKSPIKLVTTEQNKELAEIKLSINHLVYSPITQKNNNLQIERLVHVWGKQAHYLNEHAQLGDQVVVDGKLSYVNDVNKSQFIEAQHVVLLKE